jgi:hypothetical protein
MGPMMIAMFGIASGRNVEREIKLGRFKFDQHNQIHTFAQLTERYLNDGAIEHHHSAFVILFQLEFSAHLRNILKTSDKFIGPQAPSNLLSFTVQNIQSCSERSI